MLICYLSMFSRKLEKLLKCVSFTFLKLIYKSLYRLLRFFCLPLISSFVCCEKFATTVSRGVYYCLLLPYISSASVLVLRIALLKNFHFY
jgi:hypothetical protein